MQKGDKYGRLTAVRFDHEVLGKPVNIINRYTKKDGSVSEYKTVIVKKRPYWLFICDCGNEHIASTSNVKYGKTQSCGCLCKENKGATTKHGHTVGHYKGGKWSRTYMSWVSMKQRCSNKSYSSYKNYGGRGIVVHPRWEKFENFLEDMGERPKDTSLDRIDNNGNYEPGNCRWATRKEQSRNTRSTVFIKVGGEKVKAIEYAENHGITSGTVKQRIKNGWDEESLKDNKHHYRTGSMRGQEKNYALEKQQLMAIFKDSVHTAKAYLSALNEREREIIEMRFGFTNGKRNTLEEIAKAQGVTRERIRQIEAVAIEKMEDFAAQIRRT